VQLAGSREHDLVHAGFGVRLMWRRAAERLKEAGARDVAELAQAPPELEPDDMRGG
jgi:hypothetical protein